MRKMRRLGYGLVSAATWPAYLALVAFAVKSAPWPRDVAWPTFAALLGVAVSLFVMNAGRMAFRAGGWAEEDLAIPKAVRHQLRRVSMTMAVAGLALLTPAIVLNQGLIAPGGRPISAPTLSRLLILGFELTCWTLAYRLLRSKSPLLNWLTRDPSRLVWAGRQRRLVVPAILAVLSLVLILDAVGYHFTARRVISGGCLILVIFAACWGTHRLLVRLINHHSWRWGTASAPAVEPTSSAAADPTAAKPEDAVARLRTLARAAVTVLGALLWAYAFNVDLQLFQYLGSRTLGTVGEQAVTLGDVMLMLVILFATIGLWRNTQTCFTVVIFPRMTDDPGVRFAVVTLCRYAVLAVGMIAGLSAIHLGPERIGVVLAALGVGLGFGLQEIVSNFVSGIILLVERPIRVGDLVTVAGMTGSVDRINIRATTIINGDNQSMIVPNRAFITGNLVNWTHKDKVVRLAIHINVALGTDADRVTDLLLSIAHADVDVLNNPVSAAWLDSIAPAALDFVLYAYVPDPSVLGRVRHRLNGEIQRRFAAAGIIIPLPTRELRVHAMTPEDGEVVPRSHANRRHDLREPMPHAPHFHSTLAPLPAPAEACNRGVDE